MTRTATSRTVAGGLAMLLVGCATAPPPLAPPQLDAAVPAIWSARDDLGGAPDLSWWTDFDLPALNETVETALQQNYDLQAAAARLEQAPADARIAAAALLPARRLSKILRAHCRGPRDPRSFGTIPFILCVFLFCRRIGVGARRGVSFVRRS